MCARSGMDSQIDVAIHTLVQTAPPALYYHLKVAEQLLWDPWGQSSEAQFAMLLMVCTLSPAVVCITSVSNLRHGSDEGSEGVSSHRQLKVDM